MARKNPPPTPPADPFAPPDWSGDVATSLESVRTYAERKIHDEWAWYQVKKRGRSETSRRLRFLAVLFTILGGLVPLLIALFGGRPDWQWFSIAFGNVRFGQLGYLFLAIAAGLVLLDRYFGYSTGWMRYIMAMQAVEKAREAFRLDWTALARKLAMETPGTPEHGELVERLIQRARAAIIEVKEQSEKETQAWVLEFQTNLAQLEKELKSQMEAGRPGGVDVEVTDGNKSDTPVEVALDGMLADRFTGNVGSIGYVAPGVHRITVKAQKANREYLSSALVNVAGGQICKAQFTLNIP